MLPAIWPGDIVSISCQGTEEPDYPDVVLFKAERRLFVHRVLRSENGRLITRGDALPHCDPPVDVADVIGVVTEILRVRGSELVSMPVGRPSSGRRALAFVIRRSELARTIVLKWRRTFSQLSSVGMLGEESPGIDPPLRSG